MFFANWSSPVEKFICKQAIEEGIDYERIRVENKTQTVRVRGDKGCLGTDQGSRTAESGQDEIAGAAGDSTVGGR